MAKLILVLAVVLGLALADDDSELRSLRAAAEETARELRALDELDGGDDDAGRASLNDKIKELCTCASYKECTCCLKHIISLPLIGDSLSPKACAVIQVQPESKLLDVKVSVGPITALHKQVSWEPIQEKCKKIEKIKDIEFKNVEVCARMDIVESTEKGLSACIKLKLTLMDAFDKPIYFPCINFKDEKLSIDDNLDGFEQDGIKINIKDLWAKLTGKKPKPQETQ